jgi:hypothetical protein
VVRGPTILEYEYYRPFARTAIHPVQDSPTMRMSHVLLRRSLVIVLLVVSSLAIVGPASAQQGSSWAAHACQDSGYLDYERFDGSGFRNPGECMSYAAHHGALYTSPTLELIVIRDGPSTTIGVVATGLEAGSDLYVTGVDPIDNSLDLNNIFTVPALGEVNLPSFTTITCNPGFEWDLVATGTTRYGTEITDTSDFACGLIP